MGPPKYQSDIGHRKMKKVGAEHDKEHTGDERCIDRVSDGTRSSHFRGRKLRGRVLKLPSGYEGQFVTAEEDAEDCC